MKKFTVVTLLSILLVFLGMTIACGGGPSSTTPNPPTSTITSVTAFCSPTSVSTNSTSTCTASVTGTGNYSSVVTWSASAGTIDANGKFTAPATAGSVSVTATSSQDTTKTGKATITVTAPAVSVSVSPKTASVPSGLTEQFTATVVNTTNTSVTWSASSGTISSTGLLSLAGVGSGTTVTVTATSVADSTKSDNATVTVTQRQIQIVPPYSTISIPTVGYKTSLGIWIITTGAQAGDVISGTFLGQTVTGTVTASMVAQGGFYYNLGFSINSYSPGLVKIAVVSADGTIKSNVIWIAVTTDMPVLVKNATTAFFNPGFQFNAQQYSLKDGTNTQCPTTVLGSDCSGAATSIAYDEKTNSILYGPEPGGWAIIDWFLNGSGLITGSGNTIYDTNPPMSLAAKGGFGYVAQPQVYQGNGNSLGQFDISQTNPTITSVPAGNQPWTIDTATVNNADAIAVYSKEDTTINLLNNFPTVESHLFLNGITKASMVSQKTVGTGGGWPVQIFGSGPAAGTIGFLSAPDKLIDISQIDSSNAIHEVQQIPLGGIPIKIAKDEADGRLILTNFDAVNGKMTLQSIDTKTFVVTDLASSSQLPVGLCVSAVLVSDDGTTLYVAGIDSTGNPAFLIVPNK